MTILAIDPGPEQSGYVYLNDFAKPENQIAGGVTANIQVVKSLPISSFNICAIEMMASYGMAVGKEVFDTCVWIGRFIQACPIEPILVYRKDVKLHFCNTARATDANVRYAILDRFGGKEKAVGRRGAYGPLRRVKGHMWAALAIALYVQDTRSVQGSGELTHGAK